MFEEDHVSQVINDYVMNPGNVIDSVPRPARFPIIKPVQDK